MMKDLHNTTQKLSSFSDMLERSEQTYKANGITDVSMDAQGAGGYAWARQGYDFETPIARDQVKQRINSDLQSQAFLADIPQSEVPALREELAGMEHSWEIAAWNPTGGPPGQHLGKTVMSTQRYPANKNLANDSPGYQVGVAYRKARAGR